MLYSLLNTDNNFYVNICGEEAIWNLEETNLKQEKVIQEVINELREEGMKRDRLFIDFSGINIWKADYERVIGNMIKDLRDNGNEIYLIKVSEDIRKTLDLQFVNLGIEFERECSQSVEYYYSILDKTKIHLTVMECDALIKGIHVDNIMILVEDGARGKNLNLERLLADGEFCMYYFLYRLAIKMIEENEVFRDEELRNRICLVPHNEAAVLMVQILSRFLHVQAWEEPKENNVSPEREYIIIRDVIHMFFELDGITAFITGAGAKVRGSACFLNIDTGVGSVRNRVSLHTINLEKGISYRLRQKKESNSGKFSQPKE